MPEEQDNVSQLGQQPTFQQMMERIKALENALQLHGHQGYDLSRKLNAVDISRPRVGGGALFYEINDNGSFWFGDNSDGNVTITSNTTLSSDKYYNTLQVKSGVTLTTAGYRIFVKDTLIVDGTITWAANNGTAGANGAGGIGGAKGVGGAATSTAYLSGSVAGADGGKGGNNGLSGEPGVNGNNIAASSIGSAGIDGGKGGGLNNQGTGGTIVASKVKLIANWHLLTLLDIGAGGTPVKFTGSASGGGGGGGNSATGSLAAGGGGGSGSPGNIVCIYAKNIFVTTNGIISANGGNGGNGGNLEGGTNTGGGGGGSAGNGGEVIMVYNSLNNQGTISANAGSVGVGGSGNGGQGNGTTPSAGTAGNLRQFQISL